MSGVDKEGSMKVGEDNPSKTEMSGDGVTRGVSIEGKSWRNKRCRFEV